MRNAKREFFAIDPEQVITVMRLLDSDGIPIRDINKSQIEALERFMQ